MADYYPLIARAVAGLEKNSGENRRALYERARAALLAQLRGLTPALDESDITRERLALEESIRKVEAESARKFVETVRAPPPAPKVRAVELQPAERGAEPRPVERAEPRRVPDEGSPPPRRYVNPPPPQEARAPMWRRPQPPLPPAARPAPQRPAPPPRAAPPPQPLPAVKPQARPPASTAKEPLVADDAAALRLPPRRPAPERQFVPEEGGKESGKESAKDARPIDSVDLPAMPMRAERTPRDDFAPPPISDLDRGQRQGANERDRGWGRDQERDQGRPRDPSSFDRFEPRMLEPQATHEPELEHEHEPYAHHEFSEPMLESSFPMGDAHAVDGSPPRASHVPVLETEDRPSTLAWLTWRPSRGLIRGLALGAVALLVLSVLAWQWPNMIGLYRAMRAPAPVETARETPASNARPKITDRIEPGSQATPTPEQPGVQAGAAVAQKVVLYEEDPADPNGKRFVGSAIWHTETVTPGPGQPPELAVRADVEVPERKLTMTWSLRRNTDKSLPASHTVEIIFKLPPDFPSGGISNVPGILMKQAEQTRGVPLAGLAVKVTNGFFLIGLSSVEAEKERNLALLKERSWFDIPVVYNNNRRAILAMEKGNPGERVFAEAFKVWKQ
jgi:hypothetical protein